MRLLVKEERAEETSRNVDRKSLEKVFGSKVEQQFIFLLIITKFFQYFFYLSIVNRTIAIF